MKEIGAFEAKNKLSELLDLDQAGEEDIITRHGKPSPGSLPLAELSTVKKPAPPPPPSAA